MVYFKKHWPKNLQKDVKRCVEDVVRTFQISCPIWVLMQALFKDHWLSLNGSTMTEHAARSKSKKIHALLRELSDDEDNLVNVGLESLDVPSNPQRPWLNNYRAYMDFAGTRWRDSCSVVGGKSFDKIYMGWLNVFF
jgi:hypothetical protein